MRVCLYCGVLVYVYVFLYTCMCLLPHTMSTDQSGIL